MRPERGLRDKGLCSESSAREHGLGSCIWVHLYLCICDQPSPGAETTSPYCCSGIHRLPLRTAESFLPSLVGAFLMQKDGQLWLLELLVKLPVLWSEPPLLEPVGRKST